MNERTAATMIIPDSKEPACVVELQHAVRRLQEEVESLKTERFNERMRRANREIALMRTAPILIYGAVLGWMTWFLRSH
jgi:hypothetical protein